MLLAHTIELVTGPREVDYFVRAAGCARFVWNWALAEWNRQRAAGGKPSAMALKKSFNAIKYQRYPWMTDIHRDAHAQPFANLSKAWSKFFSDIKSGIKAHAPRFKKKGQCKDGFYVANDKVRFDGQSVVLPLIGRVAMREALRFPGRVMGAAVSRRADRWFISVQVEVADEVAFVPRTGNGVVGVDLGIKSAVTLSTGETFEGPKPLKAALRRLRIRSRRLSRKVEMAKPGRAAFSRDFIGPLRPNTKPQPARTSGQIDSAARLARLHARVANIRQDFLHKATTRLCRENQAIGLEDLNVGGMLKNERLARSLSDMGLSEFRRQMEYKAKRYGTHLVFADRWFPSSKLMSCCGHKLDRLALSERRVVCPACGMSHDRDHNAAINLERLATETALPVASDSATNRTARGMSPIAGGKVTSVRDEVGQQGASGREGNGAHICARFS